ncbi:MFS transporter [Novosphingobium olei]|nr:MFS transporter [Novosphingobium olei]
MTLLVDPIKADLNINDTQFGLLHGLAFALFYATMGLPIASLADRKSRPLIIAAGIAFWSFATAACGFAKSFLHLFIARIGVGAGEAALSPATYSLISDLFPPHQLGRAIAVYSLGSFLGAGLAFLVGGSVVAFVDQAQTTVLLGHTFSGWQLTFFIVGIPGILLAACVLALVKEPWDGDRVQSQEISPTMLDVFKFLILERSIFARHFIGFTLAAMSLYALLSWSAAFFMRCYDLTPGESGFRLGLIVTAFSGAGVLSCGWLMDQLQRRNIAAPPFVTGVIGAFGTAVPVAALITEPSLDVATALMAMAFFFSTYAMPPSTAVMQVIAPKNMRSRVSSIFLAVNALLGMGLSSALVGFGNDRLFEGQYATGKSLAMVVALSALAAIPILWSAVRPYADRVASKTS